MQNPQQQQWQVNEEYGAYRAGDAWGQDAEQAQKIHVQEEPVLRGTTLGIFAIVLSALGFFFTVWGVVASALVLQGANGNQTEVLAGAGMGLASSILGMLVFIAIFVLAVVTVAGRRGKIRRWMYNGPPK
jgi:hypothetical protein